MRKQVVILIFILIIIFISGFFILNNKPEEQIEENVSGNEIKEEWKQVIDSSFESVDCPSIERNLNSSYYQGKLIDTHIHISPIPDDLNGDFEGENPIMGVNTKITDYVCMMDYENTSRVFAFFPVWEPIPEFLEVVNRTMTLYPDRFVPFIMPPDNDDSPEGYPTVDSKKLQEMLSYYPGMFKGYGEIGLYERGDHGGPKGAPELPPDSQRLTEI